MKNFIFEIENGFTIANLGFKWDIPDNVSVFPLNETHISKLAALQMNCFPEYLHDSEEDIIHFLKWPVAYGLSIQNNFAGSVFGYFERNVFNLYSIEVNSDFRNKNIGTILLECAVIAALLKSKAQNLKIKKCVAEAISEGGKALLKRYGFTKIGESVIENSIADVMELKIGIG